MTSATSTPSKPSVTVSIVSHGQLAMIVPLLEQLDSLCAGSVERVVLTHNLPEADLIAGRAWSFELERIQNTERRGFGANHNAAFERCRTDWYLVLNPDIRLDSDVIAALVVAAEADAGLLAPRILEPGKTEPEQHRRIITPREILTRRKPGYPIPEKPDWIPGLFMLFRSEAYRQIGGFDEKRYFMYGEDFDICARLRLTGWRIQIGEALRARHEAQRASRRSWRHLWWHVTSLLKVWGSAAFWRLRQLPSTGADQTNGGTRGGHE